MAKSNAKTVAEYLKELPADRAKAIAAVRKVIRKNLPKGMKERMNWGLISYEIPLTVVPKTYNGQPLMYAALGSQKNYMVVHLVSLYADKTSLKEFVAGFKAAGKKLDMGKGCVRFKTLDDLPLDLVGKTIGRFTMKKYIELIRAGNPMALK